MKKFMLTAISLAVVTGLTACGGDDNQTSSNQPTPQNILKLVHFESDYSGNMISSIQRQDIQLGNGIGSMTSRDIFGKTPTPSYKYYTVGDQFFSNNIENNLGNLKNTTVTYPSSDLAKVDLDILGNDNKGSYHQELTFKKIDISGAFNFADKEKQGLVLYPSRNNFTKLPASLTFPQGSICYYAQKIVNSKDLYYFSENDATQYSTLTDFSRAMGLPSTTPVYQVGTNNELPMIAYTQNGETYYAIQYNGKVYDNLDKEEKISDYSNSKPMECSELNEIAGNYMEQQIKAVYY